VFPSISPALITDEVVDQVLRLGEAAQPIEACGVLTPDSAVVQLPNVSPKPQDSFWIDSEDLVNALLEYAVKADIDDLSLLRRDWFTIWHTHPGGVVGPSRGDIRNKIEGFQYLVVTLPDGPATLF